MPAGQPFTSLCRALARPRLADRADLHLHTTASDGTYTPAQIVELARRSGLHAISVTDHDTTAGLAAAVEAAQTPGPRLVVIPGVEITAEFEGRELHLLGYYFRPDDAALQAGLRRVREHRASRYRNMVDRLRACGAELSDEDVGEQPADASLGRRHLAAVLVKTGQAASVRDAFTRYLRDGGRAAVPKVRLPVAEAIDLVRGAGGVAAWAHPAYDCDRARVAELARLGLGAIEAEYPNVKASRVRELRGWAAEFGLAVTGGSDCHGPEPQRAVGCRTITRGELDRLRDRIST